jgi:arginine-glutamic acid dipeptide repeat-containing protein
MRTRNKAKETPRAARSRRTGGTDTPDQEKQQSQQQANDKPKKSKSSNKPETPKKGQKRATVDEQEEDKDTQKRKRGADRTDRAESPSESLTTDSNSLMDEPERENEADTLDSNNSNNLTVTSAAAAAATSSSSSVTAGGLPLDNNPVSPATTPPEESCEPSTPVVTPISPPQQPLIQSLPISVPVIHARESILDKKPLLDDSVDMKERQLDDMPLPLNQPMKLEPLPMKLEPLPMKLEPLPLSMQMSMSLPMPLAMDSAPSPSIKEEPVELQEQQPPPAQLQVAHSTSQSLGINELGSQSMPRNLSQTMNSPAGVCSSGSHQSLGSIPQSAAAIVSGPAIAMAVPSSNGNQSHPLNMQYNGPPVIVTAPQSVPQNLSQSIHIPQGLQVPPPPSLMQSARDLGQTHPENMSTGASSTISTSLGIQQLTGPPPINLNIPQNMSTSGMTPQLAPISGSPQPLGLTVMSQDTRGLSERMLPEDRITSERLRDGRLPDRISDRIVDRIQERMQDRMSERMDRVSTDRMQERLGMDRDDRDPPEPQQPRPEPINMFQPIQPPPPMMSSDRSGAIYSLAGTPPMEPQNLKIKQEIAPSEPDPLQSLKEVKVPGFQAGFPGEISYHKYI